MMTSQLIRSVLIGAGLSTVLVGLLTGCGESSQGAATSTVTVTASRPVKVPTATTVPPPATSSTFGDPQEPQTWHTTPPATYGPSSLPASSERELLTAANRFVELWARPTVGAERWLADLRPRMSPSGLALVQDTDPANVPALRVVEQPQRIAAESRDGSQQVMVMTAPGAMTVTLVPQGDRWLVSGFTLPPGMH